MRQESNTRHALGLVAQEQSNGKRLPVQLEFDGVDTKTRCSVELPTQQDKDFNGNTLNCLYG